jgi:hypothetical protein
VAAGVEHAAGDDDPLALWLAGVLGGQVGVPRLDQVLAEQRPGDLGQPVRQQDRCRRGARSAEDRYPVKASGGCTPRGRW